MSLWSKDLDVEFRAALEGLVAGEEQVGVSLNGRCEVDRIWRLKSVACSQLGRPLNHGGGD